MEVGELGVGRAAGPLQLGGAGNELVEPTHKTQQEARENLQGGGARIREAVQWAWLVPATNSQCLPTPAWHSGRCGQSYKRGVEVIITPVSMCVCVSVCVCVCVRECVCVVRI